MFLSKRYNSPSQYCLAELLMPDYLSKLGEQFIASIPNILTALLIFFLSLYFARVLSNLLKRVLLRRNSDSGVTQLLTQTLQWTVVVFGVIAAMQRFFNVTAFLAGLGIIGFTVGFALQNIMQNFVSGVIILIQQPFKVSDEINVLGFDGVVLQINLRTTEMQTLDGRIVILPNADVISHAIVNYTRAHRRRVELPLSVAHSTNPERVRSILLEVVKDVPGYVTAPAPEIAFQHFGPAIDLLAQFWVDTSITSITFAKDAALVRIKEAFAREDIELPIPAQAVYVKAEK
jgi:small-conductance mechanosensitive channel